MTEIIGSGSLMFVVCLVGVLQRNFEPAVCVCTVRRAAARRTVVGVIFNFISFKIFIKHTFNF